MAVGCSHGQMLDPAARDAVMKFKERWRPHDIMHLGDACDTTAFMGGAAGKAQESEPVRPDIDAGLEFIVDLGVTIWTLGNHEDRIWIALKDPRGIVRACAENTVATIEDLCEKQKIRLYHWTGHEEGFHNQGGYKWGHGVLWNESYIRDSAELYGNCVIAHGHRPGAELGRRSDHPHGIGVGALANTKKLDYAKAKKSTHAWGGGFVWGETCGNQAVLWLHCQPQGVKEWRLPL